MLRDALETALAEYPTGTATSNSPEDFGRAVIAEALAAAAQAVNERSPDSVQLEAQITVSLGQALETSSKCRCVRLSKDLWVCTCFKPALD